MLPNAIGPVVVNLTLSTAMFILDEAAMSFLGLGVPPGIATWGNILNAAQDLYVMQNYWWLWLPVGIVVSLFVISINCIGERTARFHRPQPGRGYREGAILETASHHRTVSRSANLFLLRQAVQQGSQRRLLRTL